MIYFDNAATSLIKPISVKNAVMIALDKFTANPGRSGHRPSILAGEMVYETREILKKFFNAPEHEVVFTKNCTEALNLGLTGVLKAGDQVITSCYEHNSVLRPLHALEKTGVEVEILDCNLSAFHDELPKHIKQNTKMIVVTGMSNVTGESPNLKAIGEIAKKHNIIFMVDGAQSSGHLVIDLQNNNIDMYAFAGHKGLYAITGVGGLIVNKNLRLTPILAGGTGTESEKLDQPTDLPEGQEAGTLPSIPIASLRAGVEFLTKNFDSIQNIENELSCYMFEQLSHLKGVNLYSSPKSKIVFSFNIEGLGCSDVATILDNKYGICVRSGLHCAPLIHKKLGTIKTGAVRASIDFFNTKQEIDRFIKAVKGIQLTYC